MAAIAAVLIHYCNTARTSPIGKGETAHQSVKSILFCALNPLQVMLSWLSLVEHLRLTDSSRLWLGFISIEGQLPTSCFQVCLVLFCGQRRAMFPKVSTFILSCAGLYPPCIYLVLVSILPMSECPQSELNSVQQLSWWKNYLYSCFTRGLYIQLGPTLCTENTGNFHCKNTIYLSHLCSLADPEHARLFLLSQHLHAVG